MPTYGKILEDLDSLLKQAFIPSPNFQQPPSQGQAGGGGQGMAQLAQQMAQGSSQTGSGGGQSQQPQSQSQPQQGQPQQDPTAIPGGDLSPKAQSKGLQNTLVTMSVADLLDLHSGGKATQSHLKTENLRVKHQFEHAKLIREERRKQEEDQQKKQQEEMMKQQQSQGMMGGGIYQGGAMDGSQPGQGQQTPQMPQQSRGF